MGNVSPSPRQLLIEAVVFWSIAVILYIGRMISRIIANGSFKRLYFDDYVMTATFLFYTALLILIQISSRYASNLMDPADYDTVLADPQQVMDRIFGSKIVIGLEQCMLFSTWGVKTCMLTLFWRLTKSLRLHLYVKIIAVYVAVGFVVIMVTYYAIYCRPFSQYWAMPVQDMQCATYQRYSITQAVFNISSDAAMLAVPIPLLLKAQMRARKKILLVCIMSLGVFTIIAAILNKYFNFESPLTTTYQIWYIREASTAIYVANLMCLWPLLRKVFGLKAFQHSSRKNRRQNARDTSGAPTSNYASQSRPSFARYRALHFGGFRNPLRKQDPGRKTGARGSQEAINKSLVEFTNAERLDAVPLDALEKKEHLSIEDSVKSACRGSIDLESGMNDDHTQHLSSQSSSKLEDTTH